MLVVVGRFCAGSSGEKHHAVVDKTGEVVGTLRIQCKILLRRELVSDVSTAECFLLSHCCIKNAK